MYKFLGKFIVKCLEAVEYGKKEEKQEEVQENSAITMGYDTETIKEWLYGEEKHGE